MVARSLENVRGDVIDVGRWDVFETQVSTNDTLLLSDYDSGQTLGQAILIKKSDRSTVTTTKLNNVVTVTMVGLTNVDCLIFVAGVAA